MEAGEELGGYRLIRRLGTGGAGTVWLAEDGGGTRVALKAMHPALAASEESRTRLERETRTVNSVRSPFVAHIVDAETEASQPFVVSEYVDGPTLAEILVSGPIPLRGVAAMSYHLASTIAAVHHANIIHRDIKPSNIICSPRGPVLIDFGIAMAVEDQHLTRTGLVSGTAGYTAPELLQGGHATKESDWWAWCATLLSCATGRPPFGKGDVTATMLRVIEGDPDLAGLHPMVADALAGGLAPDPDDRPSPSLIVAELMSAVGWAPGELDYVTVNWAQLLDTGVRTQSINSDPQEIAAPPEWDEAASRPDASGARAVAYPVHARRDASEFTAANDHTEQVDTASVAWDEHEWDDDPNDVAWHDDAADTWQAVNDADPTEVIPPYDRPSPPAPQGGYPGPHGGYPGPHGGYPDPRGGYAPGGARQMPAAPLAQPGPAWAPGAGEPGTFPSGQAAMASSWSRGAWLSGAALLAVLAALPLIAGVAGTMTVGVALTAFGLVGAMKRWLERRHLLRGPKSSDSAAVVALSPILLVKSVLTSSLALAVASLIPYSAWILLSYFHDGSAQWTWPTDVAGAPSLSRDDYWLSDPTGIVVVWGLVTLLLYVTWLMPFAADLRVGIATSIRFVVRPLWGRGLLAVGCVGFLVGTWFIITGGPPH